MSIYTNITLKYRVSRKLVLCYFILILSNIINGQVRSKAFIDHVKIDGIDLYGSITQSVTGGTAPYTYSWSPTNDLNKDLINISPNSYTVKITDNVSNTVNYYYKLGYKADWYKFYATKFRNDTLMSDGTSYSGSRSAISKNTLQSYADGWVQFVVPDYTYSDVIGFLDSISVVNSNDVYDIDYGFHMTSTNVLYAWSNNSWIYLGTTNGGDVITLERTGTSYRILKNNSVVHTNGSALLHKRLKIKVTTHTDPIANLGMSFSDTTYLEKLVQPLPTVNNILISDKDSLGSVLLNLNTGAYPFKIKWNPGEFSDRDLINKTKNNYTVTIKDANNDSVINYINLGYKAIWTKHWGTTSGLDTLYANAAQTPSGSPSAFSVNELRPNQSGWVQYVMENYSSPFVIGFADSVMAAYRGSMNDINFAFHVTTSYALYGWNGNGNWYYLGTTKKGDILKLEKSGTTFTLRKNNTSIFTHTANNNKNYRVKATLNNYLKLANVGVSFRDSTSTYSLKAFAFIDHVVPESEDSLGNIEVRISGGKSPYTFSWSPGNTSTRFKLNAGKNTYNFKVKDSKGDSLLYTYRLSNKIVWETFNGTKMSNDTLMSDGSSGYSDGNRTAISKSKLGVNVDGWIEMVYKPSEIPFVIGFCDTITNFQDAGMTDIDYAMHVTTGNALYRWNGSSWGYLGSVNENDVLRLERTSNTFYIRKNGTSMNSQSGINKDLAVKGIINSNSGSKIFNISTSFISPPLSLSSTINNVHYAILNKKLDAGYYNSVSVSSSKYFYFQFNEEYYLPTGTNLTYKLYNDQGGLVSGLSNLIEKIGDNRFGLDVTSLTTSNFYKLYVYNEKNEVWMTRIKIN